MTRLLIISLLLIVSVANAAEPIPSNVKKWKTQHDKLRNFIIKRDEDRVALVAKRLSAAPPGQRRGFQESLAHNRREVEESKAVDYEPFILMPCKPVKGDIGYIRTSRILATRGDGAYVIELNEILAGSSHEGLPRYSTSIELGKAVVTGGKPSKDGKTLELNATYEVISVEKGKGGLPVLEAKDVSKWK